MRPLLRLVLAGSLVIAAATVSAAPPTPQAEREIDQLISALGGSGCQFQRNGRWYAASDAQTHLRKKYEWLRKRDMVASAEQFIERAGSESSISGQAYQVRCGNAAAVSSAKWLNTRLAEIRRAP